MVHVTAPVAGQKGIRILQTLQDVVECVARVVPEVAGAAASVASTGVKRGVSGAIVRARLFGGARGDLWLALGLSGRTGAKSVDRPTARAFDGQPPGNRAIIANPQRL